MGRKLTHQYRWNVTATPENVDPTQTKQEKEAQELKQWVEMQEQAEQAKIGSTGWFLVSCGITMLPSPTVNGVYGPFATEAEAEDFGGYVYEPGDSLFVIQGINPADWAAVYAKYDIVEPPN